MKMKFHFLYWFFICAIHVNAQYPSNGLVAYYALDGDVKDAAEEVSNGQIIGEVVPGPNRFDQENGAMFFDGNSYVEIEATEKFQIQEAITVAMWIKPSSVYPENWMPLFNKWESIQSPDPLGRGFYVGVNPDGIRLRWNTGLVWSDGDRVYPNEWLHVATTYDADSQIIYLNGERSHARLAGAPMQRTSTVSVRMGAQSEEFDESRRYHGYMDEVLVYDRALSTAEIQQVYQGPMTSLGEVAPLIKAEVFPNPCREEVRVKWSLADERPGQVVLYDLLGQAIRHIPIHSSITSIPLGDIPTGIYLLSLQHKDQQQTIRLVKE